MLFVTSKISSYYKDAPILLNSSSFLPLLWIFRGKMTNFCMINCCLISSKRHARMAMFHCCYVFNLAMITPTILLPPSLMITSSIMLKLLGSIKLCALWWCTIVLFTFLNLLTLLFGSCDTWVCIWLWISFGISFMPVLLNAFVTQQTNMYDQAQNKYIIINIQSAKNA